MISTTIKMKYAIPILNGEKTVEYKALNHYWRVRIDPHREALERGEAVFINFLCGQKVMFKYHVLSIAVERVPADVREVVGPYTCYAIHLGERVCQKCCGPVVGGSVVPNPGYAHASLVECRACGNSESLLLGAK